MTAFLLVLVFPFTHVRAADYGNMEHDVFDLINHYRAKKHLQQLSWDNDIAKGAFKHSKDMAKGKVPFGHTGFDERVDGLMKDIPGSNAAAENVAYGAQTAEQVVEMWLNSPGHRKNIEGNFNLSGIGIEESRDGILYFTQIFIRKK